MCASTLLCHLRWSNFPPSEAPAGLWAELGPQKPMSAGCTMPGNDNRGLELNLLCTASKSPIPHSYCQGDPINCIISLPGTRGCLQDPGWGCLGSSSGVPGAVPGSVDKATVQACAVLLYK